MKNPFVIALTAALITAGAIKAAPALAEPAQSQAEINVSFVRTADIDVSSESGQRQLRQRLERAAREVCGTPSDFDLVGQNNVRECRAEAVARAQQDAVFAAAQRGAIIGVTASR